VSSYSTSSGITSAENQHSQPTTATTLRTPRLVLPGASPGVLPDLESPPIPPRSPLRTSYSDPRISTTKLDLTPEPFLPTPPTSARSQVSGQSSGEGPRQSYHGHAVVDSNLLQAITEGRERSTSMGIGEFGGPLRGVTKVVSRSSWTQFELLYPAHISPQESSLLLVGAERNSAKLRRYILDLPITPVTTSLFTAADQKGPMRSWRMTRSRFIAGRSAEGKLDPWNGWACH
jgi:hypothetical protein